MKKRGVVQQDAGYTEGWRRESGERTGQPPIAGKICQDNKLMMMIYFSQSCIRVVES